MRFPPRDQLPPGVVIPRLPAVGTTWYERGPAYWIRRVVMTLFLVGILAAWTAMIGTFVRASGPAGSPAFIGVLAGEVLFSLGSAAWLLNRFWRHTSQAWRRNWKPGRGAGLTAGSIGILARAGSAIAVAFFGVGVLLTYGLWLALFITSLAPVSPTERDARRLLAEELQPEHHRVPPTAPSGGHPGSKRSSRRRKCLPRWSALDRRGEPVPVAGADPEHGAVPVVLGVADEDRAGHVAGLDAAHPAVAAVGGLAPPGV